MDVFGVKDIILSSILSCMHGNMLISGLEMYFWLYWYSKYRLILSHSLMPQIALKYPFYVRHCDAERNEEKVKWSLPPVISRHGKTVCWESQQKYLKGILKHLLFSNTLTFSILFNEHTLSTNCVSSTVVGIQHTAGMMEIPASKEFLIWWGDTQMNKEVNKLREML